jgi:UPF0716 protein FxsA
VNKSKLFAFVLAAWIVMEVIAFVFVVQFMGLLAAIALGVGTTLLGLFDIKRLFAYLRSRVAKPKEKIKAGGNMIDGGLQALGSLLLILPGFASDLVGLALKAPSIRASVADRLRGGKARRGPRVIDLAPNEWKNLTHDKGRRRSKAAE